MTVTEILWYALAITLTVVLILLAGVLALAIPIGAERQRRRNEAVDRDLEARKAQFPNGVLDTALCDAIAEGRISPETVQRFTDRGWLNPRTDDEIRGAYQGGEQL